MLRKGPKLEELCKISSQFDFSFKIKSEKLF